jgi:hypothetical protein
MNTTNVRDEREVDRVAYPFVIVHAGLELLGQASATIVERDGTLRGFLSDAVVLTTARPTDGVENDDSSKD